jgi:hypothetical protein
MKKSYILIVIAVFFSSLAFCTKQNTTEVSAKSDYSDSIIIDLFSYKIYSAKADTYFVHSIGITAKGQPFLKPLDSSIFTSVSMNYNTYSVIVPKYIPSKFEAWVYDSMTLLQVDSSDTNVLATLYEISSVTQSWRLDTSSTNSERCIQPLYINYSYGYGFILNQVPWGIGKIKIYYK